MTASGQASLKNSKSFMLQSARFVRVWESWKAQGLPEAITAADSERL
jgi:hypothetical protein